MFELIARIVIAAAALASSGLQRGPEFEVTWRAVAFFVAYSILLHLTEAKGLRNKGVSGLAAAADSAFVAIILQSAGRLEQFGFLTLTPLAWGVSRFNVNASLVSPITAASVVSASNLFGSTGPSNILMAQAACILAIGVVYGRYTPDVIVREVEVGEPRNEELEDELRSKLRTAMVEMKHVQSKASADHLIATLSNAVIGKGEPDFNKLARAICEINNLQAVVVYTADEVNRLVPNGVHGPLSNQAMMTAIDLGREGSTSSIRVRIGRTWGTFQNDGSSRAELIIKSGGSLIGAIVLLHPSPELVDVAFSTMQDATEAIGRLMSLMEQRQSEMRRLKLAETLYTITSLATGAPSDAELAERTVHEVFDVLGVDHLSLCTRDVQLAYSGAQPQSLNFVQFDNGDGLAGWFNSGSEEVIIEDALNSSRVDKGLALKARIGSIGFLPVSKEYALITYTHRVGGINDELLATLRLISGELTQSLNRSTEGASGSFGLGSPSELRKLLSVQPEGCLVYLDVPRREQTIERYGRIAFDKGVRQVALRLKACLPSDGMLCRRTDGDYIAFLPKTSIESAREWANQAIATVAMIPVTTPDGRGKMPMALRAKVAELAARVKKFSPQVVEK